MSKPLVSVKQLDVRGKSVLGVEIQLPNSPPLVLLIGEKGFVMCGYLNIEAAERAGAMAARVVGVRSVEDVLDKEIVEVTSKARENGLAPGRRVRDVLANI